MFNIVENVNTRNDILRCQRLYPDSYYPTYVYRYYMIKRSSFVYQHTEYNGKLLSNYALKNVLEFTKVTNDFEYDCDVHRNIIPSAYKIDVQYRDDTTCISAPRLTSKFMMRINLTDDQLRYNLFIGKNHHKQLVIATIVKPTRYYKATGRHWLPLSPY